MTIDIQRAELDDPAHQTCVLELLDMYSRDAMGGGEPLPHSTRERLIDGLREHPATQVLLATEGEQCVGLCVCLESFSTFSARPILNIHDLAVHPGYRNRGIGRLLLAAVEQAARERDCCKLTLEVRADNPGAQHLYQSFGFREGEPVMHFWHKPL